MTPKAAELLRLAVRGHADRASAYAYDRDAVIRPGLLRVRGSARIQLARRLVAARLLKSEGPPLSFTGGEMFSITPRGRRRLIAQPLA